MVDKGGCKVGKKADKGGCKIGKKKKKLVVRNPGKPIIISKPKEDLLSKVAELRPLTQPTKKGSFYNKEYAKLEGKSKKDFTAIATKLNADFKKKYGYSPGIRLIKSMTPERQRRYIAQQTAKETSGLNALEEKIRKQEKK